MQVLADPARPIWTRPWARSNQALSDIRVACAREQLGIDAVNQLNDFAQALVTRARTSSRRLLPWLGRGSPTSTTSMTLRKAPSAVCCRCNFANPVQFICGGSFDTMTAGRRRPDYYRRAEICRERLGPALRRLTVNYADHVSTRF